MRTSVIIGVMIVLGGAILWTSHDRDLEANFVLNVHDDSSADWTVIIPPKTWQALQSEVAENNAHTVGLNDMGEQVLRLVGLGFKKRGFNADLCHVIAHSRSPDGSIRFDGHCSWTDAPTRQRI